MEKPTVIFIDDEKSKTLQWRTHLEKEFNVDYYENIPEIQFLRDRIVEVDAKVIIQDVMMQDRNLKYNISAGIEFAEEIADTLVPLNIPLVFFSNREFSEIKEVFEELVFPKKLLHYLAKPSTGYPDLCREIMRIRQIASQ